ncbi:MAG: 2OG-Fe(II) oxygenase [Actinobacteria bacterium]|nr:2OG-Fe(II) oxygenase [Actinomycetota bacterium]
MGDLWQPDPFPHAVIDGSWPLDQLEAAAAEFPPPQDYRWVTYPQPEEWGKRCGGPEMQGPLVRQLMAEMQSEAQRDFLAELTGIEGLVPSTLGGGMHMTGTGGRLAMHRDFNVEPSTGLERRLNVLLFLNAEWDPAWGGTLYLGEHRQVSVLPLMNRMVVFECGPASWHGHPEPVTGNHWRKSVACYWYAPPRGSLDSHSTIWQR